MKITNVRTVLLAGPYSADPHILECRPRRSAAFVEIHTDAGVTSVGGTCAGHFLPGLGGIHPDIAAIRSGTCHMSS